MGHTLRIHVDADVLPGPIQIRAQGCLTEDNCRRLFKVLDSALALQGCPQVCIDLVELEHLESAGLQALQRYIAQHQLHSDLPTVSVVAPPLPRHCLTSDPAQYSPKTTAEDTVLVGDAESGESPAATPLEPLSATVVGDLMSPITQRVHQSLSLQEAAGELATRGEPLVVVDDAHRPVSVITETDLAVAAGRDPGRWQTTPCGCTADASEAYLRVDHPIEGVVWDYQHERVRPLLVFNGSEAVGVLYPTHVFQWCTQHYPTVLETLS